MASETQVTPERIMQHVSGSWATAMLGTAAKYEVFSLVEEGVSTAHGIAERAGISRRGAQGLLDGLVGLGLLVSQGGHYANAPDAATFLVKGRPTYMGELAVLEGLESMTQVAQFPEIVRSGAPAAVGGAPPDEFFRRLVPAIAPLSYLPASVAAQALGVATAGPLEVLDVGGGSGAWAMVLARVNPRLTVTQLDRPVVNQVARELVGKAGVGDRFRTVDGDLTTDDYGAGRYDLAIYSHIAHMLGPEANLGALQKIRRALKPSGTLVIADFVLNDDRTGHPFALLFQANMLLRTEAGACWRQADYRAWLGDAGFGEIRFEPTPGPVTLIYARPR